MRYGNSKNKQLLRKSFDFNSIKVQKERPHTNQVRCRVLPSLYKEIHKPFLRNYHSFSQCLFSISDQFKALDYNQSNTESPPPNVKRLYKARTSFKEKNKTNIIKCSSKESLCKVSTTSKIRLIQINKNCKRLSVPKKPCSKLQRAAHNVSVKLQKAHFLYKQYTNELKKNIEEQIGEITEDTKKIEDNTVHKGKNDVRVDDSEMRKKRLEYICKHILNKEDINQEIAEYYFAELNALESNKTEDKPLKNKMDRRSTYGRWYLKPSEFNYRLQLSYGHNKV